jgi:hypothetical protein
MIVTLSQPKRVLSPVSIKVADDPGATVAVEPGLNVIAHTEPAERRLFMPQAIL